MHTELVKQIFELPIAERVEIIEEVSRSVRRELRNSSSKPQLSDEDKFRRSEAIRGLRGIASVEGKTPPTDEEWREERTNYLLEKYK